MRRLQGLSAEHQVWRWLGRADTTRPLVPASEGSQALFDVVPKDFSVAAVSRLADVGDAAMNVWLRADPCWLQPDMHALRMMAWSRMQLSLDQAEHLAAALRPLFGDAGIEFSIPHPDRWYLKLPMGSEPPEFVPPDRVLGEDIEGHLPDGNSGLRWRRLLNEAQMSLHEHPVNRQRAQAGLAPVNSVWFWGAGRLPNRVRSDYAAFHSDEPVLRGLALRADKQVEAVPDCLPQTLPGNSVFDLRERDVDRLATHWLEPAYRLLQSRAVSEWVLLFADGPQFSLTRSQRWRFWRRPLAPSAETIR